MYYHEIDFPRIVAPNSSPRASRTTRTAEHAQPADQSGRDQHPDIAEHVVARADPGRAQVDVPVAVAREQQEADTVDQQGDDTEDPHGGGIGEAVDEQLHAGLDAHTQPQRQLEQATDEGGARPRANRPSA